MALGAEDGVTSLDQLLCVLFPLSQALHAG